MLNAGRLEFAYNDDFAGAISKNSFMNVCEALLPNAEVEVCKYDTKPCTKYGRRRWRRMPDTLTVYIVQYLRPNGRRELQETEIDAVHESAYALMLALGWNLAAEVLTNGAISITVEDRHEEVDRAIRVVRNGPDVPLAIGAVLEEACGQGVAA